MHLYIRYMGAQYCLHVITSWSYSFLSLALHYALPAA